MKPRTKERLDRIIAGHDFDDGTVYDSGIGRLARTDRCRLCGLQLHWLHDPQNGIEDRYTFSDHENGDVPMIDVPITCDGGA